MYCYLSVMNPDSRIPLISDTQIDGSNSSRSECEYYKNDVLKKAIKIFELELCMCFITSSFHKPSRISIKLQAPNLFPK